MDLWLKGFIIGLLKRTVTANALRLINYGSAIVLFAFGAYSFYRFLSEIGG
ncbi:hypothetical protein ACFPPD_02350 [Cohnella suwonensis]|uniref:Uncharacterized protein n=1 Tax=Cohnella suwonensis TaxID=696072 RepID=A0ABW0LNR5_9BACL